jgi:hypothetical protein
MSRRFASVLLVSALGCASSAPSSVPDPRATTVRFGAALLANRIDEAYALLDPELREKLPRSRFAELCAQNHAETLELATELEHGRDHPPARAELELDDGEQVQLVLQRGRWRLAGGMLDAQSLATPLDAVAALHRALLRQSLPALLRVLSQQRRAAWAAALDKTLSQTSDPLGLQVEIHDDDATVRLHEGGEIHLKREAGTWHVWDVK